MSSTRWIRLLLFSSLALNAVLAVVILDRAPGGTPAPATRPEAEDEPPAAERDPTLEARQLTPAAVPTGNESGTDALRKPPAPAATDAVLGRLMSLEDEEERFAEAEALVESWRRLDANGRAETARSLYARIVSESSAEGLAALRCLIQVVPRDMLPPPDAPTADELRTRLAAAPPGPVLVPLAWALRPREGFVDEAWPGAVLPALVEPGFAYRNEMASVLRASELERLPDVLFDMARRGLAASTADRPHWVLEAALARTPLDGPDVSLVRLWRRTPPERRDALSSAIARAGRSAVVPKGDRLGNARRAFLEIYEGTRSPAARQQLIRRSQQAFYLWSPGRPSDASFLREVASLENRAEDSQALLALADHLARGEREELMRDLRGYGKARN